MLKSKDDKSGNNTDKKVEENKKEEEVKATEKSNTAGEKNLKLLFAQIDKKKLEQERVLEKILNFFINFFKQSSNTSLFVDKLAHLKDFYLENCNIMNSSAQNDNIGRQLTSFCSNFESFLGELTKISSSEEKRASKPINNSESNPEDEKNKSKDAQDLNWLTEIAKNKDFENKLDMLVLEAIHVRNMQKIKEVREAITFTYDDIDNPNNPKKEYHYEEFKALENKIRKKQTEVYKLHRRNNEYEKLAQDIRLTQVYEELPNKNNKLQKMLYDLADRSYKMIVSLIKKDLDDKNIQCIEDEYNFILSVYSFSVALKADEEVESNAWKQDKSITKKYLSMFADNLYKYIKDEENLCDVNQCLKYDDGGFCLYQEGIGHVRGLTNDTVREKFLMPQYSKMDDGGAGWGSCLIYAILPQMFPEEFKKIKEYVDQQESHDITFAHHPDLKLNTSNVLRMVKDAIEKHDIPYYEMVVYMRAAIALKWAENRNYNIDEKEDFYTVLGRSEEIIDDPRTGRLSNSGAFIGASDNVLGAIFKLLNRPLTLVTESNDIYKQFIGHYVTKERQESNAIYNKYKNSETQEENHLNFRDSYFDWTSCITSIFSDCEQEDQNGNGRSVSIKEIVRRINEINKIIDNDINDPDVISIHLAPGHYTPLSKAREEKDAWVSSWRDIPKIFKAECVLSNEDKETFNALKINIDTLPLNFCCNPDNLTYIKEFAYYLNELQTQDEKDDFIKLVHQKVCAPNQDQDKKNSQNVNSNQQFVLNEKVFTKEVRERRLWTDEIKNMLTELGINSWPSYGFLLVQNNIVALSNIRELLYSIDSSHIKDNFEKYFADLVTIEEEEIEGNGEQGTNKQVKKSVTINESKSLRVYAEKEFKYLLEFLSSKTNLSQVLKNSILDRAKNNVKQLLTLVYKWRSLVDNLSKTKTVAGPNIDINSYFPFVLFCAVRSNDSIFNELLTDDSVLQNLLENRIGLESNFFGLIQKKLGKKLNKQQDVDNNDLEQLSKFIKFFNGDILYLFAKVITHEDIKNINVLRPLYNLPIETLDKLMEKFVGGNVVRFVEIIKMIGKNYHPSSNEVLGTIIQESDSYDDLKPKLEIFCQTLECDGNAKLSREDFNNFHKVMTELKRSDIVKSNLFTELNLKAKMKLLGFVSDDENKQNEWRKFVNLIGKSVRLGGGVEFNWFISNMDQIIVRAETFDDLISYLNNIISIMEMYNYDKYSLPQRVSFWQSCDVINRNLLQLFNGIVKTEDKQSVSTNDILALQKISSALKQDSESGSMNQNMFWALTNKMSTQNENQKLILEKIDQYMFLEEEFEFKGINLFSMFEAGSQAKFIALTKKLVIRKDKDGNGKDINVDEKEELKFLVNYVKRMMVDSKTNKLDRLVIKAADIVINLAGDFNALRKYLLIIVESLELPSCRECFEKNEKLFLENFNKINGALLTLSQVEDGKNIDGDNKKTNEEEMESLSKLAKSLQESQLGKDLLLVLCLKLDKEKKMIIGKKIDMYVSMIKVKNFGKLSNDDKKRLWNNCKLIENALSKLSDGVEGNIKQNKNVLGQNSRNGTDMTNYVATLMCCLYNQCEMNEDLTYSLAETIIRSKETRNSVFEKIKNYHEQLNQPQPQPKQEKSDIGNSKNDDTKYTRKTNTNQSNRSV